MYEDLTAKQKEVFLKFISALDTLANRAAYSNQYKNWTDKFARSEINTMVFKFKVDELIKKQDTWDTILNLPIEYLVLLGFRKWNSNILCMPLWIFSIMPDNISFEGVDIFGSKCTINNKIDNDTRGGLLAYGIVIETKDEENV